MQYDRVNVGRCVLNLTLSSLVLVPTHKDSWLSVYSFYALKEAMTLEQKAEMEHILCIVLKV
jgi:hypothetical protein